MTINQVQKYAPFLVLAILGALGAVGFPPYNIFTLSLLSYAALFVFVHKSNSIKLATLYSFVWGLPYFVSGLWWIAEAMLVEGNAFRWAYPFAVMGLPLLLTAFPVLACLIYKKIQIHFPLPTVALSALFVMLLSISEYLRGNIFTGFPWNLPAYIWSEQLEILQSLSYLGAYGLSALTLLLSISLAAPLLDKSRSVFAFPFLMIIVFFGLYFLGASRLKENVSVPSHDVLIRLVQPNIAQKDKWNSDLYPQHLRTIEKLALSDLPETTASSVLIVLPETAVNDVMMSLPEAKEVFRNIAKTYKERGKKLYVLTGALRSHIPSRGEREYYNSALLYDQSGYIINDYDKSHLVPFGEYMPLSDIVDIAPIVGFSGFSSGDGPKTIYHEGLPSFGVAICYEVIFPKAFIDQSDRPDILFTITNDAWYGDTPGPYQHYMMARYRAIEEGILVLRSANTGVSGGFDQYGRRLGRTSVLDQKLIIDIDLSTISNP